MRAHLHDLRSEVEDQEMVNRLAEDWRTAGLDPATFGLLEYADKLTRTPWACGADDVERLRHLAFDDRAISDAVEVVAFFNYINRIAEGLGVEPEDWIDERGRPIG